MNIFECKQSFLQGKKIRRKSWRPGISVRAKKNFLFSSTYDYEFIKTQHIERITSVTHNWTLDMDDILADDWLVLKGK